MRLPNVRRLAAVDMHGSQGTRLRRRVILLEFVLGATAGTALGLFIAVAETSPGWRAFGAWIAAVCLNYVPLALWAILLSRSGRLDAELAGADLRRELSYYTKAQFWIAVPLLFVVLALLQRQARS